jgi:hypothetical protein
MEFLDINLARDASLLLHASQSLSIGGFLKEIKFNSGFKHTTKIRDTKKNLSLFVNSIL